MRTVRARIFRPTLRPIPRPFSFEWGRGQVVEEASVKVQLQNHSWEPAIQLLQFEDGSETLRFCVFHGKQFSRMPLIISSDELSALMEAASRKPRIKVLLKKSSGKLLVGEKHPVQ